MVGSLFQAELKCCQAPKGMQSLRKRGVQHPASWRHGASTGTVPSLVTSNGCLKTLQVNSKQLQTDLTDKHQIRLMISSGSLAYFPSKSLSWDHTNQASFNILSNRLREMQGENVKTGKNKNKNHTDMMPGEGKAEVSRLMLMFVKRFCLVEILHLTHKLYKQ